MGIDNILAIRRRKSFGVPVVMNNCRTRNKSRSADPVCLTSKTIANSRKLILLGDPTITVTTKLDAFGIHHDFRSPLLRII